VWTKDGQNDDIASRGSLPRVGLDLVDNQVALTHKVAASRVFLAVRAQVGPVSEPSSHVAQMVPACPPSRSGAGLHQPKPRRSKPFCCRRGGNDLARHRLRAIGDRWNGSIRIAVEFIEPGFQHVVVYALPRCDFLPRPFNFSGLPLNTLSAFGRCFPRHLAIELIANGLHQDRLPPPAVQ
jgi:hypothetical protein